MKDLDIFTEQYLHILYQDQGSNAKSIRQKAIKEISITVNTKDQKLKTTLQKIQVLQDSLKGKTLQAAINIIAKKLKSIRLGKEQTKTQQQPQKTQQPKTQDNQQTQVQVNPAN